ncbi:tetratricopeptide repeat protein [Coralloluteibacterium stylophorae]|uniref:Tetratricopeptide repeat protein n=1 Tax=Coralloluteibacterium stylophorae TaxID=1776034 RepID=A0A8J7VX66_9GAMM|nr:tetratricopeptide repeat protein [Coralloluteibacterium stylophorae]MBS7456622.1 tetratricopeptide repeat protein [Coralloluteibacterium stylophorae]
MSPRPLLCALLSALLAVAAARAQTVPELPPLDAAGLPPAALEAALAGEFALQEGDLGGAAAYYIDAAKAVEDAGLAERATRIALLAQDEPNARAALARWRTLAPDAPGVLAAAAALALRGGDLDASREDLLKLMAQPGEDGWRRVLGTLAGHQDREQVAALLADIVDRDALPDDDFQAWLAFGGLAQQLGRADLAGRIVEGAIAHFPDEPRAWLLQAGRFRMQGDPERAREAIERALAGAADDPALRLAAAGEYDALGDGRAAAATLARGAQDDASYAARASLLARAQDDVGLVELYHEIKADSAAGAAMDPERRLLLGQLAEVLDLPNEALTWYQGMPGGPERGQAQLRSAVVLEDMDRLDEARGVLHALQEDEDLDGELRRAAWLLEAELLAERGLGTEAIAVYGRALAVFEDDPELLYARALAYERADRIDLAESDFRRILALDPDNADVLNALGYTLADRTERYREALRYIRRADALRPGQPAIIDSLGWVLHRMGRNEEAVTHLRRAFELQPDAEIAAHLGQVLWALGDHDAARLVWEKGMAIDPDNRALQRAMETHLP